MAEDIRKLRTVGRIDGGGESGLELSSKGYVCERNTLCCKVRAGSEVLFEDNESRIQAVLENGVDLERDHSKAEENLRDNDNARACYRG